MGSDKNGLIWSFDVSTTNVGVALWDSNGKLLELKHLALNIDKSIPSEDRDIVKANLFKDYVLAAKKRIIKTYNSDINYCFIEAPLQNTPKNINTTALLLGFNGMIRFVLFEVLGLIPVKLTVYEIRSIFCSEFLVKKYRKGEHINVLSFPKGWKNDDKKEYIRKKVENLEPEIEWFYTRNNTIKSSSYDMSDAYACGYAGLKLLELI